MIRDGQKAIYIRSKEAIVIPQRQEDIAKLLDNPDPKSLRGLGIAWSGASLWSWRSKTNVACQAYRGSNRISDSAVQAILPISVKDPIDDLSFERPKQDDGIVCQSMTNLKVSAAMELQSGEPREQCRSIKITERFEAAISKVTGKNFSFQVARHPDLHLEVKWAGASMKLAVLPDGLRSIIAWLIACVAKLESQFPEHPEPLDIPLILLLDEPESHLHPAWQRQLRSYFRMHKSSPPLIPLS
jgi:hypothetical protein